MILTFLLTGLLYYPPVIPNTDSLEAQIVIVKMDSLEVSPLPILSNLVHGNTPVDVSFNKSILDLETQFISLRGQVVDHLDKLEIPGVRVAIGSLDSASNETFFFTPRTSVMTDHKGEFSLNTKINKSDILIVVWLGYLEKVYSFRKITN